nr:hypothetical protein [Tanacetum cinerariifolium]
MNTAVDDSLILSQSLSKYSNLKAGGINHRSWVMGNDSLRGRPGRSLGKTSRNSPTTGTDFRNALSLHMHDKLLTLVAVILVVVVGEGSSIIKLLFVIIVLGIVSKGKYQFSSFKPVDEANSAFCTFEIERLAAHKLFVATFSCYKSSTLSSVPIGIVSIWPFAMVVACASRATATLSATSFLMVA